MNSGFTDSLAKEDAAGRRTFCVVSPNSHTSVTSDQPKSADITNLPCRLIVVNTQPESVNGIKFLGVIWDHKISFHNTKKTSKIKKKKAFHYRVYNDFAMPSVFLPYLYYCVWKHQHSHFATDMHNTEKSEKANKGYSASEIYTRNVPMKRKRN